MWLRRFAVVVAIVSLAAPDLAGDAIPAFARRYGVSCQLCHNPFPTLTPFGASFAANGFRFASGEAPRDTVATGDPLLTLPARLPLAMRLDAYVRGFSNGRVATEFESPWTLKLLSGGTLSRGLSYYIYFLLAERGDVAGIEDAFVYANDIFGAPVDIAVGQFQVSDPLFKRELRLEADDYVVYRTRVGLQPADLTYERGVLVATDAAGFTLTAELVNGNGIGPAGADRHYDDGVAKNVLLHATRDVAPGFRLGALGYWGRQHGNAGTVFDELNTLWMAGGDATINVGPVELNAQYIHREDDRPTFTPGEPTVRTDGGFVEMIVRPGGSRWYGIALYNRVQADQPLLDFGLGGPANVDRYESVSGGLGWLWRRNVRVFGEVTWDVERDDGVVTLGLVTGF